MELEGSASVIRIDVLLFIFWVFVLKFRSFFHWKVRNMGPCYNAMALPRGADGGVGLQVWEVN
jgi:hypothetical protein